MINFYTKDSTLKLSDEKIEDRNYKSFDSGGVELEVGEFLYSMVRMLKPKHILETGLYSGISCMFMAEALKDNEVGSIDEVEFEPKFIANSKERLSKLGLLQYVNIYQQSSLDFNPSNNYDLILLDTEPQIRFQELVKFYPRLNDGGYLFIHDLPRSLSQGAVNTDHPEIKNWPFGDIPEQMRLWLQEGKLRLFHLPNPRGLGGFYKTKPGDY